MIRHNARIDWLTLSWSHNYSLLEDQDKHIEYLKDIFCFETFTEIKQKHQLILHGENIYICFRPYLIYIQFRGSFFYKFENYYSSIRSFARLINERFNKIEAIPYFRSLLISRIDIAIDYEDIIPNFFLDILESNIKNACFNFSKQSFEKKGVIETISLNSSFWKLRFYRKDIQIQKEKLDFKKQWYLNSFNPNSIVTRFELQLNESKNLKDQTFIFYHLDLTESDLINHSLAHFHHKHRIRIIQRTMKKDRWPDCPTWRALFYPNEEYTFVSNISEIKAGDLKLSNRAQNFTKAINTVVEYAHKWNDDFSDERISESIKQANIELSDRLKLKEKKLKMTKKYFLKLHELNESNPETVAVVPGLEEAEGQKVAEGQSKDCDSRNHGVVDAKKAA